MRRALVLGLLIGTAAAAPSAHALVPDPERASGSEVVDWRVETNRTAAQIDKIRSAGYRLTDVEVTKVSPLRLAGTFVRNQGRFARNSTWYHGRTAAQVDDLSKEANNRIVDLEPYLDSSNRLRFAFVVVHNVGEARKTWTWGHSLTAAALTKRIDDLKVRVVDLAVTKVGPLLQYSYVGISNTGVDRRVSKVLPSATLATVEAEATKSGSQILDIEKLPSSTRYAAVLAAGGGFTLLHKGGTIEKLRQAAASNGSRIGELERAGTTYLATFVDAVDGESARLRALIRKSPYGQAFFGAYSREIASRFPAPFVSPTVGREYVRLADRAPHQPMSVMKLVPHLYAMREVDRGRADLDATTITWRRPPGRPDESCEVPGSTETFSTSLRVVLQQAMFQSLNRAHETLLDRWTAKAITADARSAPIGMTDTVMYDGCEKPGLPTWLASRTTLHDLSKLYESAETLRAFPVGGETTLARFFSLIAPGGAIETRLEQIVQEEGQALGVSQGFIDATKSALEVRGKPGGVDNVSGTKRVMGRAYAYRVRLLRNTNAGSVAFPHVGAFFANDVIGPCTEAEFQQSGAASCAPFATAMSETFTTVAAEVMRVPIRESLRTWLPAR